MVIHGKLLSIIEVQIIQGVHFVLEDMLFPVKMIWQLKDPTC